MSRCAFHAFNIKKKTHLWSIFYVPLKITEYAPEPVI
jgi:hypothetical protein